MSNGIKEISDAVNECLMEKSMHALCHDDDGQNKSSLTPGAIAGISVAAILGAVCLAALVKHCYDKKSLDTAEYARSINLDLDNEIVEKRRGLTV